MAKTKSIVKTPELIKSTVRWSRETAYWLSYPVTKQYRNYTQSRNSVSYIKLYKDKRYPVIHTLGSILQLTTP